MTIQKINTSIKPSEEVDKINEVITDLNGKADDNTVVHITGNETISGEKSFTYLVEKTTSTSFGACVDFIQEINNGRRGTLRTMYNSDGSYSVMLGNNGPDASSPAGISVIRDATKTWAEAPSTPDVGDNSRKIATTAHVKNLLSTLYPVGSIYIGTQSTCPLSTLISGSTWVKVSEGRVLQGSDSSHSAGTTIAAGLPDITGSFDASVWNGAASGIFKMTNRETHPRGSSGANMTFDTYDVRASYSNSIYGNSTTVQPPAFVVNIWQRTA